LDFDAAAACIHMRPRDREVGVFVGVVVVDGAAEV
jgi:hypothetical protein